MSSDSKDSKEAVVTSEWTLKTTAAEVSQKCFMIIEGIVKNMEMYTASPSDLTSVIDAAREWLLEHWEADLRDVNGYCLPDIVWMSTAYCLVTDESSRPAAQLAREIITNALPLVPASTRSSLLRMDSTSANKDDLKKASALPEPRSWAEVAVYMLRRLKLKMIGYNHPFRIPGTCAELKAERDRRRAAIVDLKNLEAVNYAKHVAKRAVADPEDMSVIEHPTDFPVKYPSDRLDAETKTVACKLVDSIPDAQLEIYCAVLLTDYQCPIVRPEFVSVCTRYFGWTRFHETFWAKFETKSQDWRKDTAAMTAKIKRHSIATKRLSPTANYKNDYEAFMMGMFAPMGGRMHCIRQSHGERKQLQARPYYQLAKVLNELEPSNLLTDAIAEPIRSWTSAAEIKAANDEKTVHHDIELFFRAVENLDQYIQVRRKGDASASTVLKEYVCLPDDVFDMKETLQCEYKYYQGAVVARPKMVFSGGKFLVLEKGKYKMECRGFVDAYCCWIQLIRDQYNGTFEEKSTLIKYLRDLETEEEY